MTTSSTSLISLILSIAALLAVGIQTWLQWRANEVPMRANIQIMQLQACTTVVEALVKFSNNNAERRLVLAEQTGQPTVGIQSSAKADSNLPARSKSELEEVLKQKTELGYGLAEQLNLSLLSNAHIFKKADRDILTDILHMILPLTLEPEGTAKSTPRELFDRIESFRTACKNIGRPLLEGN